MNPNKFNYSQQYQQHTDWQSTEQCSAVKHKMGMLKGQHHAFQPVGLTQNFEESIQTASVSSCLKTKSLAGWLAVGLLTTSIRSAQCMEGGKVVTSSRANDLMPEVRSHIGSGYFTCSSMRLNDNQIVTAKHCVADIAQNDIRVVTQSGLFHKIKEVKTHPKQDIAILTTVSTLDGENVCPPEVMFSRDFSQALLKAKAGEHNACQAKDSQESLGDIIIAARGNKAAFSSSTHSISLTSGNFLLQGVDAIDMRMIIDEANSVNPKASIRKGDSGAPVFLCNPKTHQYETVGVVGGTQKKIDDIGNEISGQEVLATNRAAHRNIFFPSEPQVKNWLELNSEECTGEDVAIDEVFPNQNLHQANRAKAKYCTDVNAQVVGNEAHIKVINHCKQPTRTTLKFIGHSTTKTIEVLKAHANQTAHFSANISPISNDAEIKVRVRYVK